MTLECLYFFSISNGDGVNWKCMQKSPRDATTTNRLVLPLFFFDFIVTYFSHIPKKLFSPPHLKRDIFGTRNSFCSAAGQENFFRRFFFLRLSGSFGEFSGVERRRTRRHSLYSDHRLFFSSMLEIRGRLSKLTAAPYS